MKNIEIFEIGYCKHPEFVVMKGGSFKPIKFPAMVALINEEILFDTGYSEHFFNATKQFPEKLYAITTPITLEKPLKSIINKKINLIFISHFHADHIGGIKDFPNTKVLCSKKAYYLAKNKELSRFNKTKKGILPDLLGPEFENNLEFIEDLEKIKLPEKLLPFKEGYLLKENIYIIELPGHSIGQYGLYLEKENVFLISDSVWNIKTITENRRPHIITKLIMEDWVEYNKTIDKLQELNKREPNIKIIPTHCSETIKKYKDEKNV